jgi:hypothetical protein
MACTDINSEDRLVQKTQPNSESAGIPCRIFLFYTRRIGSHDSAVNDSAKKRLIRTQAPYSFSIR